MNNGWQQLIKVREQQKAAAAEALTAARREAEHTAARCDQAQRALSDRVDARAGTWLGAIGRFSAGSLDIEHLRRAGLFDAVASRRVADAGRHCEAAQAQLRFLEAQVARAQDWLRSRRAALEKAQSMDDRAQAMQRQREEQQAEQSTEETALAAWLRGRGRWTP
jgi:hypothetical protein